MLTPLAYFDLIETLPTRGCAICTLVLRDTDSFLDSLLYERVMELETHQAFRARRGLCNEHSWQLLRYKGGALGIAVLYQATLDEVLKALEQPAAERLQPGFARRFAGSADPGGKAVAQRLSATDDCSACKLLAESEARYVDTFSQHIGDERLQQTYSDSDSLCLPHFRLVAGKVRATSDLQQLVGMQKAIWNRLKNELAIFIDKNDYRQLNEKMGPEGDSWKRAIAQMSGERGVFGVDRRNA